MSVLVWSHHNGSFPSVVSLKCSIVPMLYWFQNALSVAWPRWSKTCYQNPFLKIEHCKYTCQKFLLRNLSSFSSHAWSTGYYKEVWKTPEWAALPSPSSRPEALVTWNSWSCLKFTPLPFTSGKLLLAKGNRAFLRPPSWFNPFKLYHSKIAATLSCHWRILSSVGWEEGCTAQVDVPFQKFRETLSNGLCPGGNSN